MHAEDRAFNDCSSYKVVENVSTVLPRVNVSVLTQAFVIETILHCDASRFVVSSEDCNAARVLELKAEQELEDFAGELSTVDEVTHENVVGIWDLSTFLE